MQNTREVQSPVEISADEIRKHQQSIVTGQEQGSSTHEHQGNVKMK